VTVWNARTLREATMSTPEFDPDLTRGPAGDGTPSQSLPRPVSGGRYRLGATLGEGGMAVVVEAEDANLKRTVAVKRLRPALRGDAAAVDRFFDEAEIMAGLDHPGLVSVHEAGVFADGEPFYAMAKVRGRTLNELMHRDPGAGLRVSMALVDVLQRVAETMGFVHARRIVHRDLKPENIMVDDHGAVYVMDWGIAKRVGPPSAADESLRTVQGAVLGTPSYMAPELASGQAYAADARADVFALGVMLYELLTGRRPFKSDTAQGVLQAVQQQTPTDPRTVNKLVPRELSAICLKALAKDPGERYPTARELADDIRNFRSFLPVSAVAPRWRDRARNWMRRHPRLSASVGTAAAALLLLAAAVGYRVASERAIVERSWQNHEAIAAEVVELERQLADLDAQPLPPESSEAQRRKLSFDRAAIRERLDLKRDDLRTSLVAIFGLTFTRPDRRVLDALSRGLHEEIARLLREHDYVRVKVLVETRLELMERFGGIAVWPAEERGYLQATLDRANAELAREVEGG